jgi:hypothetical protein
MQVIRDMVARLETLEASASPRWRIGVAILGSILCLIGLGAVAQLWILNPAYLDAGTHDLHINTDLDLYIRAADSLSNNPYYVEPGGGIDRYGYPPLLAGVIAGLKWLVGPAAVGILWVALGAATLACAIILLSRRFGVTLGWHWIVLVAGVVSLGRVVRMDLHHGQVNGLILLLLAGGILLRSQNRIVLASLLFAVMMSLKPFMGLVMIYFALRGDWRMVRWGLGMGAAVFLASFLPTWPNMAEAANGWREAMNHFTHPPFITKPDNQSAYGLFLRMFTETHYAKPWVNAPDLVPAFMAVSVTVAAILAIVGLHLKGGPDRPQIGPKPAVMLLECMTIYALVAFCGPLTEGNHMILAFGGLAATMIIGIERIRSYSPNTLVWGLAIIAWAALCFFVVYPKMAWFTLGNSATWVDVEGWKILLSGRCALLLLTAGGLTAVAMWRERVTMAAQSSSAERRFRSVTARPVFVANTYRLEENPQPRPQRRRRASR